MTTITLPQGALRRFTLEQVLKFDALTCGAFGALLAVAAAPLAGLLGLPPALPLYAGLALIPCAVLMWLAARTLARPLVWTVILGNVGWVIGSIAVIFAFDLTTFGITFVLAQAVFVDVLAVMEWSRRHGAGTR
jgi:hypothetical protein